MSAARLVPVVGLLLLLFGPAATGAAGRRAADGTPSFAASGGVVLTRVSVADDRGAIRRASALLRGKRFTRFVETGSIGVPSSFDQRLHLCSSGRFILDQVSNLPDVGDPAVTRTTGRWRVIWASFSGRRAVARVRGVPDRGRPVTVVIATDGRRTTIDGNLVSVGRSDLCA